MSQTIVAVDIGGTKIACGLVTLGGESPVIEKVEKVPTEAMEGGDHVLATVIAQVRAALPIARRPAASYHTSATELPLRKIERIASA